MNVRRADIRAFGMGICCFAAGTLVEIMLPDVLIVTVMSCGLLAVGVLMLKG